MGRDLYFAALEDWIGVYDRNTGALLFQGHSIDEAELCELLGVTYEWKYMDEYHDSYFPQTLSELGIND